MSGQLWRVIKQTATVISFAFFVICCWWRERKTADKIWPSASDWLWVHKASSGFNFSWGGSPRRRSRWVGVEVAVPIAVAVTVAVHVTKMSQSAQRNQKRSAIFHSHLKCARSSKHHNITPSRFIIIFLSLFSSFFIFWKRVMMKFCVRSFVFVKYLL